MDFQSILNEIKNQVAPLYVVFGTEFSLRSQVRLALRNLVLNNNEATNFVELNARNVSINDILEEAQTVSFFGDRRLIFVDDVYFLTTEKASLDPAEVERLLQYLKQPVASSVVVFFTNQNLDGKRKIVRELKKQAIVLDLNPLQEADVRQVLLEKVHQAHFEIDQEALNLLLLLSDHHNKTFDLSKALNDLESLILYRQNEQKITKTDVEELVTKNLDYNIFNLNNFIMDQKIDQALNLLTEILATGAEPIAVNALLLSQIRFLLQVSILHQQGLSESEIATKLHANFYRVKFSFANLGKFSDQALISLFNELVDNDYQLKSKKVNAKLLLELTILKIPQKITMKKR